MKREKYVNKDWLEARVKELYNELHNHHHEVAEEQRLKSRISYYINKLADLERGVNIYVKIDDDAKTNQLWKNPSLRRWVTTQNKPNLLRKGARTPDNGTLPVPVRAKP